MDVTRREIGTVTAGALAASAISRLVATAAAASTVRFSFQRSSTLLTLLKEDRALVAAFAAKGFGVGWAQFDDVIGEMNAAVCDFHADCADAVPIFTQSARAPLTFYAREVHNPQAEAIIVSKGSAIRTVADLKGRLVGVHRGSGCHFILAAALTRAGLTFADIHPAYLTPSDAAAAFERGSIDAWAIWDPFLAIAESKMPTRTLCDATGLSRYDRYYTVTNGFAEAHPDLVEIVFDALVAKGAWVRANPDEAARRLSPIWGNIPEAVVRTVNRRRSYDVQAIDARALGDQQAIADTFFEAKLIPRAIDATAIRIWHPRGDRT